MRQTAWLSGERALLTEEGASANVLRQELLATWRDSKRWSDQGSVVGDEIRKVTGVILYSALEAFVIPLDFTWSEKESHRRF